MVQILTSMCTIYQQIWSLQFRIIFGSVWCGHGTSYELATWNEEAQ